MPGPKLQPLPLFYDLALHDLFGKSRVLGSKPGADGRPQRATVNVDLNKLDSSITPEQKIDYLIAHGVKVEDQVKACITAGNNYYATHLSFQADYFKAAGNYNVAPIANVEPSFSAAYTAAHQAMQADLALQGQLGSAGAVLALTPATKDAVDRLLEKAIPASVNALKAQVSQQDLSSLVNKTRIELNNPNPAGNIALLKAEYNRLGLQFDISSYMKLQEKNNKRAVDDATITAHLEYCREVTKKELEKTAVAMLADEEFIGNSLKQHPGGILTFINGKNVLDPAAATTLSRGLLSDYGGHLQAKSQDPNLLTSERYKKDFNDAHNIFRANLADRKAEIIYKQADAQYRDINNVQITTQSNAAALPNFGDNQARAFIVPGSHPRLVATYKGGTWTILNDTINEQPFWKKGPMKAKDFAMEKLFNESPAQHPTFDKLQEMGLTRAQILSMYVMIWQRDVIDAGKDSTEPLQVIGNPMHKVGVVQGLVGSGAKLIPGLQDQVQQMDPKFTEGLQKIEEASAAINAFNREEAIAVVDNARGAPERQRLAAEKQDKEAAVAAARTKTKELKTKIAEVLKLTNEIGTAFVTLREGMKAAKHAADVEAAVARAAGGPAAAPGAPAAPVPVVAGVAAMLGGGAAVAAALGGAAAAAQAGAAAVRGSVQAMNARFNARDVRIGGGGHVLMLENSDPANDKRDQGYKAKIIKEETKKAIDEWKECKKLLEQLKQQRTALKARNALSAEEANRFDAAITKMQQQVDKYTDKSLDGHATNPRPKSPLYKIKEEFRNSSFGPASDGIRTHVTNPPTWWHEATATAAAPAVAPPPPPLGGGAVVGGPPPGGVGGTLSDDSSEDDSHVSLDGDADDGGVELDDLGADNGTGAPGL